MKTVHRKGTAVNVQITDADPVFRDLIFSVVVFYAHPFSLMDGTEDIPENRVHSPLHFNYLNHYPIKFTASP